MKERKLQNEQPRQSSAESGPSPIRLEQALHEVSVYGIGATSDTNQRVIVEAAKALAAIRAQPQRDMTKWPDTLRFDDRDKYIDELEAQIERLRAVPAVSNKDLLNWIENEASRGLSEGDAREALTAIKWKIKDGR